MKLDVVQIERIRDETGIEPIPELEPSLDRLEENFGDHTFYVDPMGLYIWQAVDGSVERRTEVMALQVASWADDDMTVLQVHEPKATGRTVVLETIH